MMKLIRLFLLIIFSMRPVFSVSDLKEDISGSIACHRSFNKRQTRGHPSVSLSEYSYLYLPQARETKARAQGVITRKELGVLLQALMENPRFIHDDQVCISNTGLIAYLPNPSRFLSYVCASEKTTTHNLSHLLPKGVPDGIWSLSGDSRVFLIWNSRNRASLYRYDLSSSNMHHLYQTRKGGELIFPHLYEEDYAQLDEQSWSLPIGEVINSDEESDDETSTSSSQCSETVRARLFRIPFGATHLVEAPEIDFFGLNPILGFVTNRKLEPAYIYCVPAGVIELNKVLDKVSHVLLQGFRSGVTCLDTINNVPYPSLTRPFFQAFNNTCTDKPMPCLYDVEDYMKVYPLMRKEEVESHDFEISSWILNPEDPHHLLVYSLKDALGTWFGRNPLGQKIASLLNQEQAAHDVVLKEQDTSSNGRVIYLRSLNNYEKKHGILLIQDEPRLNWLDLTPCLPIQQHIHSRIAKPLSFEFKARDGLCIESLITLPIHPLPHNPGVILVHGGPNSRDKYRFNSEAAFLASHGLNVLRVNFRGSSGRGAKFTLAGKSWGGAMLDDLEDAINFAHNNGWLNKEELAAMGSSYGAYASTLLSLRNANMIKCVIAFSGTYDFLAISNEEAIALHHCDLSSEHDRSLLSKLSPISQASQVACPLLLMHGLADDNCPYASAERMFQELRKFGKTAAFAKFNYCGHGHPRNLADFVTFFGLLENFLGQHMRIPYVPLRSTEINSRRIQIQDPDNLIGEGLSNWDDQ